MAQREAPQREALQSLNPSTSPNREHCNPTTRSVAYEGQSSQEKHKLSHSYKGVR